MCGNLGHSEFRHYESSAIDLGSRNLPSLQQHSNPVVIVTRSSAQLLLTVLHFHSSASGDTFIHGNYGLFSNNRLSGSMLPPYLKSMTTTEKSYCIPKK